MKCHPEVLELFSVTNLLMAELGRVTANQGRPITCRGLGCSACCYEPVYADFLEVDHALGRVDDKLRKRIRARTELWVKVVEPSGMLDEKMPNVFRWRALKAACPFLENNQCSIYNDRPIACRQHAAIGPPENCYDDEKRRVQLYASSNEVDAKLVLWMVRSGVFTRQDNLGCILANILLRKTVKSASFVDWKKLKSEGVLAGHEQQTTDRPRETHAGPGEDGPGGS
jgi:Fe-S-cluster containining protein